MEAAMSTSLVQNQFGQNAAAYATSAVHAAGESLAMLVRMAGPRANWRALDVATGAGHMALAFAPHVAHVTASDITAEMLAETRALAAGRGIANLETALAPADRLPFADATFDLVSCRLAAHHFADPAAFVSEAARVLKPGGTFALVDNVSPDGALMPDLDRSAIRAAVVVYNQFEKLRDPSHGHALTVAEWLELADDAGLEVSAHEVIAKAMEFGAWTARIQCTPETVSRLAAMIDPALPSSASLAAFLMPRRADDGLWISLRELLMVARKRPSASDA